MRKTVVAMSAFFSACSSMTAVPINPASISDTDILAETTGSCVSGERKFDLLKMMILENRHLDVVEGEKKWRIVLDGEIVSITDTADADETTSILNVGYELVPDGDIDIDLKLALLDGELMVYWRETYKHRIYKQGLFKIVGDDIESVCKGGGGSRRSH